MGNRIVLVFAILLTCQLAGEVITRLLHLPLPGPVLGMVILFCGLLVRGACETVGMGLQSWVNKREADPNWAILQVDVKNAFNSLSRKTILDSVGANAPELMAWAKYMYANHSLLFQEGEPLASANGVQ